MYAAVLEVTWCCDKVSVVVNQVKRKPRIISESRLCKRKRRGSTLQILPGNYRPIEKLCAENLRKSSYLGLKREEKTSDPDYGA